MSNKKKNVIYVKFGIMIFMSESMELQLGDLQFEDD